MSANESPRESLRNSRRKSPRNSRHESPRNSRHESPRHCGAALAALGYGIAMWPLTAYAGPPPAESPPGNAFEQFLTAEHVTTWLRADYFQSSNSLDDQENLIGAALQIKALPHLSDLIDAKLEGRLTIPDIRARRGYGPQGELLEGYATLHTKRLDLRVGKQIIAWGRADGINPTDNLTPRNYLVLLPLEEDQRFGTWGARIDAYLSQALTFEVFASPDFEPDKFPLPTKGTEVEIRQPGHSFHHTVTGVKLNNVSEAFDGSLSYYRGYSLLPTVDSASPAFELSYSRVQILGADGARNFGRFGFRSEVAYTLPEDRSSADPNSAQRRLFWVNGLDRTFLENLNLNVQIFVRWMNHYDHPEGLPNPNSRMAGGLNAIIGGQEAGISPGLTFRVSNQWLNNTLRAELLSLTNFKRGDHYLRPLITYDVSDRTQVLAGANLYGGPHTTQFGLQRPDTGIFMEVRYAL